MPSPRRALETPPPASPLRDAAEVMRLSRFGAAFPTRLSFSRALISALAKSRARVSRDLWEINGEGFGRAVYRVDWGAHQYALAAFSAPLEDARRTDRVIAEAWDTTYALYDGMPSAAALRALENNAPKQEAGRYDKKVLALSRANKSARMFRHTVERLAAGAQPDIARVCDTGYLMRTTAVYGNGKFGIADRARIAHRPALRAPFQAELLAVWLIRAFTHDLAEHIAAAAGGDNSVKFAAPVKRHIGVGNSTGLGMAPFLVNHPLLLHSWLTACETAIARVLAVRETTPAAVRRARALARRAAAHLAEWRIADEKHAGEIAALRGEWRRAQSLIAGEKWTAVSYPWQYLADAVGEPSRACRELFLSLLVEAHGHLVDDLRESMQSDERPRLKPAMTAGELRRLLAEHCAWALARDFNDENENRFFWYVSAEKLEPRRGQTGVDAGGERALPLDIARQLRRLADDLANAPAAQTTAAFLAAHPQHRHAVRRAQTLAAHPYAEIRDNVIGGDCLPIDMLRLKLSFLGAAKFDPKSDLWTRIVLFQGAPLPEDITGGDGGDWWLAAMNAPA